MTVEKKAAERNKADALRASLPRKKMSKLGAVIDSVEKHEKFVREQVKRARKQENTGQRAAREQSGMRGDGHGGRNTIA